MYKKLVRYDEWHFAEVDPVCLRRIAVSLRDQILHKISKENDVYDFYGQTMPVVEAAIRGEIKTPFDDDDMEFLSANYEHDQREGLLPHGYNDEFTSVVSEFCTTIQGLSIEPFEEVVRDGAVYGWVDFEEKGDWPDKVKYK